MAKKKEDIVSDEINYISTIEKQLSKDYGDGVFVNATDITEKKQTIIPWSTSIDMLLSGGVPEGSAVSISGKYKTGKSVSALTLAAQAQKFGYTTFYLDVEHRVKNKHLLGIKGLDLNPEKFKIIKSTQGKILSTQDFLKAAEIILKTRPSSLVIIDSFSSLVDSRELEGGIGTETRGHNAKIISQFVNINSNTLRVMKSILIGINHLIANVSGYGAPFQEKSSNRWLYDTDIRLRIKASKPWLNSAKIEMGKIITWQCEESSLGAPGLQTDGYLRYNKGLDSLQEKIEMATSVGLITPKGAWYEISFLKPEHLIGTEYEGKEKVQVQGMENVYKLLEQNEKWQELLGNSVNAFVTSLVSSGTE